MIVGRGAELARLRELTADLAAGRGAVVWLEGEPGIGKSALLEAGLADAERLGCQLLWGTADELSQRLPLRVMLDALGVHPRARDPRRAEIAAFLEAPATRTGFGAFDPTAGVAERVLALVDQLCADAPVALVIDDLQWADDASLLVWQRLSVAVRQVPLLLVGAARPVPRRPELAALRQRLSTDAAHVIQLPPLDTGEAAELATALVGAPVGHGLRRSLTRAGGNPLYITELVSAVLREFGQDHLDQVSEEHLPDSLSKIIAARFGFVSDASTEVLRLSSLLGTEFTVTDLAVVSGRSARSLVPVIDESIAGGVLTESGMRLRFRHPLFRATLYIRMPVALRDALHLQAAQALAGADAPFDRIVHQLLPISELTDTWAVHWLAENAANLTYQVPSLGWELLSRAAEHLAPDDPLRDTLELHVGAASLLLARYDDVLRTTAPLATRTADPVVAAEATWLLGNAYMRLGRMDLAIAAIEDRLRRHSLSAAWVSRMQVLRAMILLRLSRYDEAARVADDVLLDEGVDPLTASYALHVRSTIMTRTDHDDAEVVATIDRALAILGDDLQSADLRVLHLVNRSSHLFDLDRLEDADAALFEARRLVERIGTARLQTVHTFAIEYSFLSGRWDNAVAELESGAGSFETFYYYEPAISRGVAALIAGHRDNLLVLRSILADYADQDLLAADIRANSAWLILARALLAERSSDEHRAFTELAPVLEYTTELDNVHTLLPDLVRLAIATGRADFAASAAAVAAEMTKGRAPYYHAIAAHCRSLAEGNPELLSATIESYFRHARRPFELARALEDAAVLLAQRGQRELARPCLSESVDLYATLGAAWDIRRADTRLRALGVRRGSRGPRHRPATGWDALTPTERTVADLVAEGRSNPDIAGQLFLSRSTVQTHVSHILAKLALHSRGQVAHLVLQHAYPGATEPLQ